MNENLTVISKQGKRGHKTGEIAQVVNLMGKSLKRPQRHDLDHSAYPALAMRREPVQKLGFGHVIGFEFTRIRMFLGIMQMYSPFELSLSS